MIIQMIETGSANDSTGFGDLVWDHMAGEMES